MRRIGFMSGEVMLYLEGDSPAQSTSESTSDIITSLTKYLPAYMQVQNEQVLPQSLAQLQAAQQISPAYGALLDRLYKQYAPSMARTGAQVENINRIGSANTDLDILRGPGGALAGEAQRIDRTLNPEFYKTREATSDKLGQLLSSINLDDANPEAERLIGQENARTGNIGNTSNTSTVSNALSFGAEKEKRRNSLGQALNLATNFLQPAQGSFNPVVTALNRPSTNTGENRFGGVTNPSGQAYESAGALAGQIGQIGAQRADINANRRDTLDRVNETMSSLPSV